MRSARQLHHAVSALLLLLLLSSVVPADRAQQEIDDESEFSYIRGAKNGPENWGTFKEEWATCGTGQMQSPIDLSDRRASPSPDLGYLNHSYVPADASIVNRGHDIAVMFHGDAGSLSIDGTAYHLRQVHWHAPSEHRVNGRRYSLELHMVHLSAQNKTAVIGLLYKIGRRDHFLHKLEPYLMRMADMKEKEEKVGLVDPGEVATVSTDQLKLLTDAVHDGFEMNARPLQKVNDRDIRFFCPDDDHERYDAAADH
ncbi:alpha carbonic anhydrase 7-like isoform X2 [Hordeum vulgare subsp. vulgare]|uniref:alpha carbonic anhydrase 7-like isoform X2 n=1 Tax=Hordeum vulgare subsp. vulgare TaxID=112509 RepID=UPI001D1A44AA|nr:alpha carbonic anhydrase 7-like isoform X2 [Hordeum vulgare subsp. vulgare]